MSRSFTIQNDSTRKMIATRFRVQGVGLRERKPEKSTSARTGAAVDRSHGGFPTLGVPFWSSSYYGLYYIRVYIRVSLFREAAKSYMVVSQNKGTPI